MSSPTKSNSFDDSMDLFDDEQDTNAVDEPNNILHSNTYSNEQKYMSGKIPNFQCPFCDEFESDEHHLSLHIQSTHVENNSQNLELNSIAIANSYVEDFEKVINGISDIESFVCPYCDASHDKKDSLAKHLTSVHGEELEHKDLEELIRSLDMLLCPLCIFVSSSAVEIQQHMDSNHSSKKNSHQSNSDIGSSVDWPDMALVASATARSHHSVVMTCPVCGLEEADPDILASHVELHFDTSSSSSASASFRGTSSNPSTSRKAQIVHSSSSTSSASSSSESTGNRVLDKRKRNDHHYKHQYKQGLEKAVVTGKMSPADYYDRLAMMQEKETHGVDDGLSKVEGLIEQLQTFYRHNSRPAQTAILCHPTDFYCGSYGDRGWGCGYRNLQMLLSCLSRIDMFSHKLFRDGRVRIPSVPKIQELIETAWQNGFDIEGCQQLNGRIVHTKKWIGATEIVATLSSLGIRCELVDFPRPSSADGTHPRLVQWVKEYFYHMDQNNNAKPPLYLQHQGHSRTIVGVEEDKGTSRLLLFDPGSTSEHVTSLRRGQLTWKQMGTFRRNLAAFKAKQYQIVAVRGLLSRGEYERSKRLTSTRIL